MSKIGIVQQINGVNVMIDEIWYDGSSIKQYIPGDEIIGQQVEYNHDENNVLAFIRAKTSFTPKNTKGNFKKKASFTPKNTGGDARTDSIIKQVIFKVAGNMASRFSYNSVEEAITTFDGLYNQLKKKYDSELK